MVPPLIVFDDRFIINSYVETDILQHYAGWINFRNSPWHFPLGFTDNLGYPQGTMISFTDSIPLAAIFFKIFAGVLPDTFQYFGIWILLCFILQGLAASLLLKEFKVSKSVYFAGLLFFLCSPILLERSFRHTALGSHFLILFAIYLYCHSIRCTKIFCWWKYSILLTLAIGIHPYFLPLIFVFVIANIIDCWNTDRQKNHISKLLFYGALTLAVPALWGYAIGVIGQGIRLRGDGFGFYSMNLNSIINPISCGKILWSQILTVMPQIRGNYDGFNYLGLGILLLIVHIAVGLLLRTSSSQNSITGVLKSHVGLISVIVFMTLFAVSNVVTLNDKELLTYPLPKFTRFFTGSFRASSRMFYGVYYLIILGCIVYADRCFRSIKIQKVSINLLALFLAIQLFDIWPALKAKHLLFQPQTISETYAQNHAEFEKSFYEFAKDAASVIHLEWTTFDKELACYEGKARIPHSNVNLANRGNYAETFKFTQKAFDELSKGKINPKTLYVVGKEESLQALPLEKFTILHPKEKVYLLKARL